MEDSSLLKYCTFVLILICLTNSQSLSHIIQTSVGPIQGTIINTDSGIVYQFLGIPYAQPPLGDFRFREPQPVEPWNEILNANQMPPACIQYIEEADLAFDFEDGKSEDCLYLNIWVPETTANTDNKSKKSVMFWIHGGGYVVGSNRKPLYNGQILAIEGDVIVVTINYRLGAFGFFTTNKATAPPNVALYDMLEALKWVNKNIDAFGGDPNKVTLFGESAGARAIGLFCVSPLTKGLFSRVIMESGSPANVQYSNDTNNLSISQRLAEALGCANSEEDISNFPDQVANCMRGKEALEIAKTLYSFNTANGFLYFPVYGNEILPGDAQEVLKSGKFHDVSVLIGENRDVGSIYLTNYYPAIFGYFGDKLTELAIPVTEILLKDVFKFTLKGLPDSDQVAQTIMEKLSKDDYMKNLKIIYDFIGDFIHVCPDVYFAESYSKFGKKVYFYRFQHRPSITPYEEWMGVVRMEEVQFVFGAPLRDNRYTSDEIKLSKYMMKVWSNFAKYGDPLYNETKQHKNNTLILKEWPIYYEEIPLFLMLDETTRKAERYSLGPHKFNCDLLRTIHGFPKNE